MTYLDCINILKENYHRGGEIDETGLFRHTNGGNKLYLIGKTGGWTFICTNKKSTMTFIKYSINNKGEYKNNGKYRRSDIIDLIDVFNRSTKYAVVTPRQEAERIKTGMSAEKTLVWKNIER